MYFSSLLLSVGVLVLSFSLSEIDDLMQKFHNHLVLKFSVGPRTPYAWSTLLSVFHVLLCIVRILLWTVDFFQG